MKFRISETVPCFVTWICEIEANDEEHARQLFKDGERGRGESEPMIGDSIDYAPQELLIEPVDELDGTSGQDRESYSDTQDRDSYTVSEDK